MRGCRRRRPTPRRTRSVLRRTPPRACPSTRVDAQHASGGTDAWERGVPRRCSPLADITPSTWTGHCCRSTGLLVKARSARSFGTGASSGPSAVSSDFLFFDIR
jgi:hypothetical protein